MNDYGYYCCNCFTCDFVYRYEIGLKKGEKWPKSITCKYCGSQALKCILVPHDIIKRCELYSIRKRKDKEKEEILKKWEMEERNFTIIHGGGGSKTAS